MDIEEIAAKHPDALVRLPIDIRKGLDAGAGARAAARSAGLDRDALVDLLLRLYAVYAGSDAELVEINPLVVTKDGRLVALDCKLAIDDSARAAARGAGRDGHARDSSPSSRRAARRWASSSSSSTAASACSPTAPASP